MVSSTLYTLHSSVMCVHALISLPKTLLENSPMSGLFKRGL